jgi:hypothetical protein
LRDLNQRYELVEHLPKLRGPDPVPQSPLAAEPADATEIDLIESPREW